MKTITLFACLFLGGMSFAQSTLGDIIGTFMSADKKENIYGAYVFTNRGDEVFRTLTDTDGRFRMSAIPAGEYKIYFVYEGDTTYAPQLVEVSPDGIGDVGVVYNQTVSTTILPGADVYADRIRLTRGVAPEIKLGKKDIAHMGVKFDAKAMISTMTTDVRLTDDGSLVFRGARKGDLVNYIDGVKMTDVQNVPSAALGYIMVYSGAIPAKYGDTTGGVVIMETLSYFDLYRDWLAKQP